MTIRFILLWFAGLLTGYFFAAMVNAKLDAQELANAYLELKEAVNNSLTVSLYERDEGNN